MMASNPPYLMEDQTDEDFFDKLVNDDDDFGAPPLSSAVHTVADGGDSDEIKAFANLSLNEVGNGLEDRDFQSGRVETKGGDTEEVFVNNDVKARLTDEANVEVKNSSLVSSNSSEFDRVLDCNNGSAGVQVNSTASKSSGSTNSGVKEVQWSAFGADMTQNGSNGFGSYSDIFGELGDGSSESHVSANSKLNHESQISPGNATLDLGVSDSHAHRQEDLGYDAGTERFSYGNDPNSSQYWENLYPGWKYDTNTGQWYQLDGYDPASSLQGYAESNSASDWAVSDVKAEFSYYKQPAVSVGGTVTETAVPGSVTNLNQISGSGGSSGDVSNRSYPSQENEGYAPHMAFDPSYPDWYYDTIAQEWRTLESYTSSAKVITEGQNRQAESDFSSGALFHETDRETHGEFAHGNSYVSEGGSMQSYNSMQSHAYDWAGSFVNKDHQASNVWQSEAVSRREVVSESSASQPVVNHFNPTFPSNNTQQNHHKYESFHEKVTQGRTNLSATSGTQVFSGGNYIQQLNQPRIEQVEHLNVSNASYANQNSINFSHSTFQNGHQFSFSSSAGHSSAGRPPHALVSFGFGGKLVILKENTNFSSYGNQDCGGSISVLNLAEVTSEKRVASSSEGSFNDYFRVLCQQSFPGPLTGGNASMKELNKWMDERIAECDAPSVDCRNGRLLGLLFSLLKIAFQHYGKLRSPFNSDVTFKDNDGPELAVARLFASAGSNSSQFGGYCLQSLPPEGQMQATAFKVQSLLVSGRKKDALQLAQEGQLWGPALVLAAQLGDQFYVDTVKQMAVRQLVAGSPLRTLCLLIAGQPAQVFSADLSTTSAVSNSMSMSQQPAQPGSNCLLDDWEENLALITANRTKDDELVLIHLGDCLWKEKSEIIGAHICYLVAEANFETYSDRARFCLIGADHWKSPRTYASPEAIQRTEIYEYSKVIGNSQFVLLPFQPYRIVYAHMLAEVGRLSDSLKYCQAILKSLKTGRSQEVELWRQFVSSLEERIRTHQQGGFSTNLAPAKYVGKLLLNLIDSTAHRVVGGLPPPVPGPSVGNVQANEHYQQSGGHRVSSSQSTMAMSSLVPSTSMEPISERMADVSRTATYGRSVSEPDFGRTPRQNQVDSAKEAVSYDSQGKTSAVASRFGRFGSNLLQKTVGFLKPRQDRQAKLGDANKFYYDEKLKRWVEEGAEPPTEEAVLPPPPTSGTFQNGGANYNLSNALKSEGTLSNGVPEFTSPVSAEHGSGVPSIPSISNQFSARARMGVRSRYVDTFNKGGGNPTNLFQSPSVPSVKPSVSNNRTFFVPTPVSSVETLANPVPDTMQETCVVNDNLSIGRVGELRKSTTPASATCMPRFASMDNIPNDGTASLSSLSRRTASWSGSLPSNSSPPSGLEAKTLGEAQRLPPSSFINNTSTLTHPSMDSGLRDELQEVEL